MCQTCHGIDGLSKVPDAPKIAGEPESYLVGQPQASNIFGPVLVNCIREYNVTHGVPKAQPYKCTMYIMADLLAIGFFLQLLHKSRERALSHERRS